MAEAQVLLMILLMQMASIDTDGREGMCLSYMPCYLLAQPSVISSDMIVVALWHIPVPVFSA